MYDAKEGESKNQDGGVRFALSATIKNSDVNVLADSF